MLARLAIFAILALPISAAEYTIFHRFAEPGAEFVPRGVVTVDNGQARYEASAAASSAAESESTWYQVAIRVGDQYLTASSPSCFANEDATLTLHFTGDRPSNIEYKPGGPADGACKSSGPAALPLSTAGVDVQIRHAHLVRSPSLAPPKEVDTTGQTKEPEPEKTFLQKYWMAIVAALLFFATVMAPEEPPKGAAGGARAGAGGAPQRLK